MNLSRANQVKSTILQDYKVIIQNHFHGVRIRQARPESSCKLKTGHGRLKKLDMSTVRLLYKKSREVNSGKIRKESEDSQKRKSSIMAVPNIPRVSRPCRLISSLNSSQQDIDTSDCRSTGSELINENPNNGFSRTSLHAFNIPSIRSIRSCHRPKADCSIDNIQMQDSYSKMSILEHQLRRSALLTCKNSRSMINDIHALGRQTDGLKRNMNTGKMDIRYRKLM